LSARRASVLPARKGAATLKGGHSSAQTRLQGLKALEIRRSFVSELKLRPPKAWGHERRGAGLGRPPLQRQSEERRRDASATKEPV